MPALQQSMMRTLYGKNVWEGFSPRLDAELQGWNGDHPSLGKLVNAAKNPLVVDVGVWKGMSTINMALAMRDAGLDGCVIAVDTFLGSPQMWEGNAFGGLFTRSHGLPDLYRTFLSNAWNAGVADYIIPLPQTTLIAATILRQRQIAPSLVHIDAAHEYDDVIRDLQAYYALISNGGYLVGDDYSAAWPGVVRAVGEFSARHGLPLTIEFPKWIVRKP